MLDSGACAVGQAPRRVAAMVAVAVCVLRCQPPSKGELFDARAEGSAGAPAGSPAAGSGEVPIDFPALVPNAPGAPSGTGAAGSTTENPPPLGIAGAPQDTPGSTGVAGATGPSDVGGLPAPPDAGAAPAPAPAPDCVLGPFQEPELLTGLEQGLNTNLNLDLWAPALSAEGSTLFFAVGVVGVDEQIFSATREGLGAAFGPAAVAGINSAGEDGAPLPSADGRSLYFYSTRQGGLGDRDVWVATRADQTGEFAAPTPVAGVNTPNMDHLPWLSPDELTMVWTTNRAGGSGQLDIWAARRSFRSDGFSNAAPLNGVNSTVNEGRAVLSQDELTIYFASERPGGAGGMDLWVATRNDTAESFSQVANLDGLNSASLDQDPILSADERELIFSSGRDGRIRLWRSVRDCE